METIISIFYVITLFFKIMLGLDGFEKEKEFKNIQFFYTDNISESQVNDALRIIYSYYSEDGGVNNEFAFQLFKEGNEYKLKIPLNEEYYSLSEEEKEEIKKFNQLLVDELSIKIFNGDYVYFDLYDSYFNEIDGITNENYKNENKTILNYIETGYVLDQEIYGDLNNDGSEDCVLLIKGTDKNKYEVNEYNINDKKDRNRRGLIVLLKRKGNYDMIYKNNDCIFPVFDSDEIVKPMNDDGTRDAYHPPKLNIFVKNGNLYIHSIEGYYQKEYKKFTFRYNKSIKELELIGFDCNLQSDMLNDYDFSDELSINYLTKKMNYKVATDIDEYGDYIYNDIWLDIELESMIFLSDINKFDDVSIDDLKEYFTVMN